MRVPLTAGGDCNNFFHINSEINSFVEYHTRDYMIQCPASHAASGGAWAEVRAAPFGAGEMVEANSVLVDFRGNR